ncbi:hypothetical protein [Bradyrhizobium sp. CCBAU 25338]|jgi:hypothetical protein|uniref:hypothetical protein n=1 Tax=Bradyrhizobium sp. CCBAU 25338 TaxID=1641877 RepID=UPI002302C768|nr:hypothetical protein [Bradyrhizobium sp. CCBAU 25338]
MQQQAGVTMRNYGRLASRRILILGMADDPFAVTIVYKMNVGFRFMRNASDIIRTVSRHTLAYMLFSMSELFRHYDEFDPLDLLIIHAVLNANVIHVMNDPALDEKFSSIHAVEPDVIKQGVSRAALSRFLSLPLETVRRRVTGLKRRKILAETKAGLIVTEQNAFRFGNNHELQKTNMLLLTKLLRDLRRAGISGPDDLRASKGATSAKKAK